MKLQQKLIMGFILVALIVGATGWIMFSGVSKTAMVAQEKLHDKQQEINDITALTSKIQDFHIENFHEQLEVWEYAYEPNEKRLNAFYGHLITWERLFSEFIELAHKADLTDEEVGLVNDLQKGIVLVRKSWFDFVKVTEKQSTGIIESATLKADGTEKYPLLDDMAEYGYAYSYPMFDMTTADASDPVLFESMVAMEHLFDDANFNKNTDKFVLLQQKKQADKQVEMEKLSVDLNAELKSKEKQFFNMFVIIMIAVVGLALFYAKIITKPMEELSATANKLTDGDFDVEVPKIKTGDEVEKLGNMIGFLVDTIKSLKKNKK